MERVCLALRAFFAPLSALPPPPLPLAARGATQRAARAGEGAACGAASGAPMKLQRSMAAAGVVALRAARAQDGALACG